MLANPLAHVPRLMALAVVQDNVEPDMGGVTAANPFEKGQHLWPTLVRALPTPQAVRLQIIRGQQIPRAMWTFVGRWQSLHLLVLGPAYSMMRPDF